MSIFSFLQANAAGQEGPILMEPIAYFNGNIIPASQACLPVYDAGVVLGATVSDLLRTFRGKLFRLDEHLDRFLASLRMARLQIDLDRAALAAIANQLVAHNFEAAELGLVVFVTAGDVATFSQMIDRPFRNTPTVCMHTFPLDIERYRAATKNGVRLITPNVRQVPVSCWDPRIKCRSRMHYYLAEREVYDIDPGATALLLDIHGNVTETGSANFLIVHQGAIVTPPHDSVLPGISQAVTIELAAKLGIPCVERVIPAKDLANAEEAFLASTPYCLAPVTHINGTSVGSGLPGPIYGRLIEAWNLEVGLNV